jgi:hypothetical protein
MARKNLDNLGFARVFRHPRTGQLVVDTDSLRRPNTFAGSADFGADDFGDEELGDDDDDFDDEDDDDGEDFGDEELGDDFGDEEVGDEVEGEDFGANGRLRRRRLRRRLARLNRRESRVRRKIRRSRARNGLPTRQSPMKWGMTAVSGTSTLVAAGAASVKIRLQHTLRAKDITFTGSVAGAKVTSIFFGDRAVWSSSDGIDVAVFGSTSFLRGLLKGQSLDAGLDIIVNGMTPGAGDFSVTIIGAKPVTHC